MVVDFADVLRVDLLDHSHHQASSGFLRFRVVSEVETGLAIRADVLRICRMASAAFGTKRGLPLVHQLVNLISGHRLRQNLQIGRRRRGTVSMFVFMGLRGGGGLLG